MRDARVASPSVATGDEEIGDSGRGLPSGVGGVDMTDGRSCEVEGDNERG